MVDQETKIDGRAEAFCGWTKLWHPKGVQATLPLPCDPKAAFDAVGQYLEVGWLLQAPGLEEGELKEEVGYVLRGSIEHDGQTTTTLLLYSTNDAMSFSFLKVYLNKPEDVAAFEYACNIKLAALPEYDGADKPERGKSAKTDRYIVKLARPTTVILKNNPRWIEADQKAAVAKGDIYKVPKRVFIRWADQKPVEANPPAEKPQTFMNEIDQDIEAARADLRKRLDPDMNLADLNKLKSEVRSKQHQFVRVALWRDLVTFAQDNGCQWNDKAKLFETA